MILTYNLQVIHGFLDTLRNIKNEALTTLKSKDICIHCSTVGKLKETV